MPADRSLAFAEPKADALLAAAKGASHLRIVGSGALADRIAKAAGKGVEVVRERHAGQPPSGADEAVIFAETDGEKLRAELARCVAWPTGRLIAPLTSGHFTRTPLFLVSIPKAGTHLLYELARTLGYAEGVELPEFAEPGTWYCVDYSNSHTQAADFFVDTVRRSPFGARHHPFMGSPTLFMYRHPLDILVSEAHYYHRDGATAFAGWLDGHDFDARVEKLMSDRWLLGPLRERVGAFLPWLDFPNVAAISFEELIGESGGGEAQVQLDAIWSVLLKLQAPGDPAAIAGKLFNPNAATFRSGQIGGYAQALSGETIGRFAAEGADVLRGFGYPADGSVALPAGREARRLQPLTVSTANFDATAIQVEASYLGCNLVRFRGRIRAVPQSAGPLALDKLKPEQLDLLPSARSVPELKALLLLGPPTLAERIESYSLLGRSLAASPDERGVPKVVDSYSRFNLVAYAGHVLGLRQAAGAIDLSGSLNDIAGRYPPGDVLIGRSGAEVRDEIDGYATSVRAWRVANEAKAAATEGAKALRAEVAELSKRLAAEQTASAKDLGLHLADLAAQLDAAAAEAAETRGDIERRLDAAVGDQARIRAELTEQAVHARAAEDRLAGLLDTQAEAAAAETARLDRATDAVLARIESEAANVIAVRDALGDAMGIVQGRLTMLEDPARDTELRQAIDDLGQALAADGARLDSVAARLTEEAVARADTLAGDLVKLGERVAEARLDAARRLNTLAADDAALRQALEAGRTDIETLRGDLGAARDTAAAADAETRAALGRAVRQARDAAATALSGETRQRTEALAALADALSRQGADLTTQMTAVAAALDAGLDQNLGVARGLEALIARGREDTADELVRLQAAWREARLETETLQSRLDGLERSWAARLDRGLKRLLPGKPEPRRPLH